MSGKVIHLPRPRPQRPAPKGLGFYVRAGRNDHRALLDLLATGDEGIFGLVVNAQHLDRHRALITEARQRDLDVILDPNILQMGFPGAVTDGLSALPWGLKRHHNVKDFEGSAGQLRAAQIVEAAASNGCTQLLGPTHLLSSPNDPWLRGKGLQDKQRKMSQYRQTITHLVESDAAPSVAVTPSRRQARERG